MRGIGTPVLTCSVPLLVLLWLALLGVVPAAPAAARAAGAASARAERSAERHPEPEALRAPPAARIVAARPTGQLVPVTPQRHAPPFALAAAAGRRDHGGGTARCTIARQRSHVAAAQGGLLPYFPTAPPLQG